MIGLRGGSWARPHTLIIARSSNFSKQVVEGWQLNTDNGTDGIGVLFRLQLVAIVASCRDTWSNALMKRVSGAKAKDLR